MVSRFLYLVRAEGGRDWVVGMEADLGREEELAAGESLIPGRAVV